VPSLPLLRTGTGNSEQRRPQGLPTEMVGREFEPLCRSLHQGGAATISVFTDTSESTATHLQDPFFHDARSCAPNTPRQPLSLAGEQVCQRQGGRRCSEAETSPPKKLKPQGSVWQPPPAMPCPSAHGRAPAAALPGPLCAAGSQGEPGGSHGCYVRHLRLAQWAVGARGRDRLMYCVRGRRAVT